MCATSVFPLLPHLPSLHFRAPALSALSEETDSARPGMSFAAHFHLTRASFAVLHLRFPPPPSTPTTPPSLLPPPTPAPPTPTVLPPLAASSTNVSPPLRSLPFLPSAETPESIQENSVTTALRTPTILTLNAEPTALLNDAETTSSTLLWNSVMTETPNQMTVVLPNASPNVSPPQTRFPPRSSSFRSRIPINPSNTLPLLSSPSNPRYLINPIHLINPPFPTPVPPLSR